MQMQDQRIQYGNGFVVQTNTLCKELVVACGVDVVPSFTQGKIC